MIEWISKNFSKGQARRSTDVYISIVRRQAEWQSFNITFQNNSFGRLLNTTQRLTIGIDKEKNRIYFLNSKDGHKVGKTGSESAVVRISCNKLARAFPNYDFKKYCGDYYLQQDENGEWFIEKGELICMTQAVDKRP